MYANHPHRSQGRHSYQDDEDSYYGPGPAPAYARPPLPPQQAPGSSRRRPNALPQDPTHIHFYHRHRDDRDSWTPPGPTLDVGPQSTRRQSSTATNNTPDYTVHPRTRRARSSSATRLARSKSSSPRRHAAVPLPTAPPIPQLGLSERETLARQRLQTTFETYVFSTLPTHLLRVTDMTLVTRNEIWEMFRPRVESLSDSHLAKLLLEQDEEARKLGVSVIDPQVLAPFVEYSRSLVNFAVFSHRWGNGEPLFYELPNKRFHTSRRSPPSGSGYPKLLKFCEKAQTDYGCEYVWSDTCCINKESSTELEEAILSMGVWYSEAGVCIVHLGNSSTLEDFMAEPWFTRSWTLQELLLPRKIRFYGKDWSPICPESVEGRQEERAGKESREDQRINDKDNDSVIAVITKVTGIPEADIRHFVPGCTRVSEKMRWASQRVTSRVEDTAYALLGLFDVCMPITYGDGHRAFHKLMSTLAQHCIEPDFFAWAGKPSQWSLALPSSPQCYGPQASPQPDLVAPLASSALVLGDPMYELTKVGLRTRLVIVPAFCEAFEPTDGHTVRMLLTPTLAIAQEAIQVYVPLASVVQQQHGHGPSRTYEYDHDPRERDREREREKEYAFGVVDYDVRPGPPGYVALHAGRPHLCLVLERERERERRGRGRSRWGSLGWGSAWVRVARPGALSVRFRESELVPVEDVCLLHRAPS